MTTGRFPLPEFTARVAELTARELGCIFWRPCTRPVYTGVRFPLSEFTARVDGCQKMHPSSRANGMANLSVCLSSVTCVHPTQGGLTFRGYFAPYCSLAIRQLTHQKSWRSSKGITPSERVKQEGGGQTGESGISPPISRYLFIIQLENIRKPKSGIDNRFCRIVAYCRSTLLHHQVTFGYPISWSMSFVYTVASESRYNSLSRKRSIHK